MHARWKISGSVTAQEFRGEGILAITKALLQSGVAYVGGYQGSPISHLMDVLADASDYMAELGVHFESSASEATAAAMLSASVMYPIRGAVTWKSTAGTNVASDALSNLASGGVNGGAVIIIGEDYGEGSSIMQERSHAFAMKSQIWLMDPRPDLPTMVRMVEKAFELSEASNTPVMVEVRIRGCHVHGRFTAKDNVKPAYTLKQALENPVRDVNRIVLPPASFIHEKLKIEKRWPAAVNFIREQKLNEVLRAGEADVGIILQGGMYNGVIRALQQLGLSDAYGNTRRPALCAERHLSAGRRRGRRLLCRTSPPWWWWRKASPNSSSRRSTPCCAGGTSTPASPARTCSRWRANTPHTVLQKGLLGFLEAHAPLLLGNRPPLPDPSAVLNSKEVAGACQRGSAAPAGLLHRLPGAPDLRGDEARREGTGPASRLGGHRLPPVLDPAALQHRRHHHGLWPGPRRGLRLQREGRTSA